MISPHPLQLLLRKLENYAALDQATREAVLELPFTLKSVRPQGYVTREGEAPDSCCVLVAGFAFRQKLAGDGSRQILSVHISGEPLDFQNLYLDEADHSIQALTTAEIACMPKDAVQRVMSAYPDLARAIQAYTLVEASIFREWILNVGQRPARVRLSHFLCELAVRLEAQGLAQRHGFVLPLTQQELADVTGMTSVHVNRSLKALEAEGLIERQGRVVTIPDWDRFAEAADFSDRYLHAEAPAPGDGPIVAMGAIIT